MSAREQDDLLHIAPCSYYSDTGSTEVVDGQEVFKKFRELVSH